MPPIDKLLAGLVLAICLVLAARMTMSAPRRARFDRWVQRRWRAVRQRGSGLGQRVRMLRQGRSTRAAAQREAAEAIRRAREGGVDRDGNVYRPKSFRRPDKMH